MKAKSLIRLTVLVLLFAAQVRVLAQSWSPLGTGLRASPYSEVCSALVMYNGKLIAGGAFDSAGSAQVNGIAQWDGNTWSPLGNGFVMDNNFGGVNALAVYNGNLYAGGVFDSVGGIAAKNIAMWDGSQWHSIGAATFENSYSGGVNAFTLYQGNLVAGGGFDTIGGIAANCVARWNGSTWSAMSSGIPVGSGVNAFAVYNGTLYAGGQFMDITGTDTVAYGLASLSGNTWSLEAQVVCPKFFVCNTYACSAGTVTALAVYQGKLYAGGTFDSIGGVPAFIIACKTNGAWTALDTSLFPAVGTEPAYINALAVFNGYLYAGGLQIIPPVAADTIMVPEDSIYVDINITYPAAWNGTNWLAAGGPLYNGASIYCFLADGATFYAGGSFATMWDNHTVNNIIQTKGVSDIPPVSNDAMVRVFPNPNSGKFSVLLQNLPGECRMDVYDMQGSRVMQTALTANLTGLDLSAQAKGIYLYRVISNEGEVVQSGKVVLE